MSAQPEMKQQPIVKLPEAFHPTRFKNDANQLVLTIRGLPAVLLNWSQTGIGFELPPDASPLKEGTRFTAISLTCGDIELYRGDIEVRWSGPGESGGTYYGAAFASGPFAVDTVDAALEVNRTARALASDAGEMEAVDPGFCQSVLALSAGLRATREACAAQEAALKLLPQDRRREAERVFLSEMARKVRTVFVHFNVKISEQVEVEKLPEDSRYHRVFREEIYPYFEGADLIRRAYEKPRGYAGDYEMMNQIYRDGFEGTDLFGKILHHYIANENSGESVKFRKLYLYGFYCKALERAGEQNVLSVACGPAVEYQEAVSLWRPEDLSRVRVTLFDLDREALEHVQARVLELADRRKVEPRVVYVNASVKSFLYANAHTHEKFDLIYSAGLFDYLDNLTSAALVRKFSAMLKPGGTLVIGNFTHANLTKAFLHLLTRWTLIHKSEQEMLNWTTGIEGCTAEIQFDQLKMNAFLVLRRGEQ
jgi:SAM-dependent methyltransferase